ncbi:MAG: reductive dehalogenase domain-containing protein [Pseudomonadota bacterium]
MNMRFAPIILLVFSSFFCAAAALFFAIESFREKEPRAPWIGLGGVIFFAAIAEIIYMFPVTQPFIFLLFLLIGLIFIIFLIPTAPNLKAIEGAKGYAVAHVSRFDERDIVFSRNRSLRPSSKEYRAYYSLHPEKEATDARRRSKGGPVGRIGDIDNGYPPNVAMIEACFQIPTIFGNHIDATLPKGGPLHPLDLQKASTIIKGFAAHLGSDLVGICRVNPEWGYSHRGEIFYDNWNDWGKELDSPLPFAVVIATEMEHEMVGAGPHTPALMESAKNYAKGSFIATTLSRWFISMGYRAVPEHSRHYDLNMVPLAIDAGLGELGRFGYLITDRFGPRVRLFAVITDMPLTTDKPSDLGVDGFCRRCRKCADSCPSKSIPHGEKAVINGIEKWKINEETCFDYWAKVGTDCSICMGICPFSRPCSPIHRLARWMIRRSSPTQMVFPYIDNLIYGKRWKPRPVSEWINYRSVITHPGTGE